MDGNGVGDMAVGAYGEAGIAGAVYILYLQNSRSRPVKVRKGSSLLSFVGGDGVRIV